jgi:small subunit ribosomal protein S3
MVNKSQIRKFVDINVERQLVREYLLKETERAGFGGLHFERAFEGTSMCTKITLKAERVGMVIGRKGKIINELQRRIREDFNLENPKLQVEEIGDPTLNAQVMASKLASALERGWYFRRAGHSTVLNIMESGARGVLIVLNGKVTGGRHRTQKFTAGHIKYCGETALEHMEIGFATAVKKLGTIGCTVAIMRAGAKLPHEIELRSRHEVGLEPIVIPAITSKDIVEEELDEEQADTELERLEEVASEAEFTDSTEDTDVVDVSESETEEVAEGVEAEAEAEAEVEADGAQESESAAEEVAEEAAEETEAEQEAEAESEETAEETEAEQEAEAESEEAAEAEVESDAAESSDDAEQEDES